jgi:hypothetical protein
MRRQVGTQHEALKYLLRMVEDRLEHWKFDRLLDSVDAPDVSMGV